jgi:polyvinyl alcohol dehydrogenase (cytochrome)
MAFDLAIGRGLRRPAAALEILVVALAALAAAADPGGDAASDWSYAGNDLQNTRNAAAEHAIGVDNAAALHVKWAFAALGGIRATPTSVGGSVYVPDSGGFLHRLDADTGVPVWSIKLSEVLGQPSLVIASRTSPVVFGNKVIIGTVRVCTGPRAAQVCPFPSAVVALNKSTGALLWSTQVDDHPYATLVGSPVVFGTRLFIGVSSNEETPASFPDYPCCSFRGSMLALDVNTGQILWKTSTVPPGYAGGAIWSSTPVVDLVRNSVYFTTGNDYMLPAAVLQCVIDHLDAPQTDPEAPLPADPAEIEACYDPGNHFDSIVAVRPDTGAVRWSFRGLVYDNFVGACFVPFLGAFCPNPHGPDYDFGAGANLFHVSDAKGGRDLLGAGEKSGVYWAVDPDSGERVWSTKVGPGGDNGGIQFGTSVDGARVYIAENNRPIPFGRPPVPYMLPSGQVIDYGSFAALDATTGSILWQVPNPVGGENTGQTTVANGVVYACERAQGRMFAFDASSGALLWDFASGGSCTGGPSVVKGSVYWGNGTGPTGNKLYAFTVD